MQIGNIKTEQFLFILKTHKNNPEIFGSFHKGLRRKGSHDQCFVLLDAIYLINEATSIFQKRKLH